MSEYPEHDKLKKVQDQSETIGAFLDMGLPAQNMVIYENVEVPCECERCEEHKTTPKSPWHTDAVRFEQGVAYYKRYRPTMKRIEQILADHFGIDLDKISEEKEQMYRSITEKAKV